MAINQASTDGWIHQPNPGKGDGCGGGGQAGSLRTLDLRLMPIGDSITFGIGSTDGNGYRANLYNALHGEAKNVDFVGTQQNSNGPDNDNEGYPAKEINDIKGFVHQPLMTFKPNVVTLMAGTNDMNFNDNVADAPNRLSQAIDQMIVDSGGSATMVVASLVPSGNPDFEARIQTYNQSLRDVVNQKIARGTKIVLADMSALTTADLTSDGVHPNEAATSRWPTPGTPRSSRRPARA
jgi:lysophospholipase L1-like esterase